jgi:hypothetical protein
MWLMKICVGTATVYGRTPCQGKLAMAASICIHGGLSKTRLLSRIFARQKLEVGEFCITPTVQYSETVPSMGTQSCFMKQYLTGSGVG